MCLCDQSEPDSGYHTGSGVVLNASTSKYTPSERTLTREDLRRRITAFNSNNHGLIMEPVGRRHCVKCTAAVWVIFPRYFMHKIGE